MLMLINAILGNVMEILSIIYLCSQIGRKSENSFKNLRTNIVPVLLECASYLKVALRDLETGKGVIFILFFFFFNLIVLELNFPRYKKI